MVMKRGQCPLLELPKWHKMAVFCRMTMFGAATWKNGFQLAKSKGFSFGRPLPPCLCLNLKLR